MAEQNIKTPRRLNFACESCRAKKRRCDGAQPQCRLCSNLKTPCIYKGNPSPKYVQNLEDHCAKLRDTLSRIKHASAAERDQLLSSMDEGETQAAAHDPMDGLEERFKEQAKISTDGGDRLSLHGPSSLYYLSSTGHSHASPPSADHVNDALDIEHHLLLDWIDSVAMTASVPAMSNEIWQYMLKMHFTWVQPLFGFVHHRSFLRDMRRPRTQQSMFSPFLLYSLCSHVIRQPDIVLISDGPNPTDPFMPQAKLLVFREVERGSSLSAISGLLTLSAQVMSLGEVSQGWVYLGMAIRMVEDLGIHLDGREAEVESKFSSDELFSRRHVFWSAFLWDKMVSLYLGRVPMLKLSKASPGPIVGDPDIDRELWTPLGNRLDGFPPFVPTPSYELSTFANACQLGVIINDIMVYDAGEAGAPHLETIRQSLGKWHNSLPDGLSFDPKIQPDRVPPSHVINLNCLYHMIFILLDRRQRVDVVQDSTVKSALDICVLAQLSHKYFCDRQAVLSHCYCIYVAAGVFLSKLRMRTDDHWLSDQDAVLVTSLQWSLQRLQHASVTISALRIPISVLQEISSSLPPLITALIRPDNGSASLSTENLAPPIPDQQATQVDSTQAAFTLPIEPVQINPVLQQQANPTFFTDDFWSWLGGGELASDAQWTQPSFSS